MTAFLRGEGLECENHSARKYRSFTDDFARLYDEVLEQEAEIRDEAALFPRAEAWMKLTSLLQMRNSSLEHQVRELQDTNVSLLRDVEWHIDAISKLEDVLKEAHSEIAVAFTEVSDLKSQLTGAQNRTDGAAVPPTESCKDSSVYSDMTSSGLSEESTSSSMDSDLDSLWLHEGPIADGCAMVFYFFPSTSLILLKSSPHRSSLWYQFPPGSILPQIHEILIDRYNKESHSKLVFQILQILDLREVLGIELPDSLHQEMVKVGLPNLETVFDLHGDIPFAAWKAFHTVDEQRNLESWQHWYDLVEQDQNSRCTRSDHSDRAYEEDAARLFGDWSWGIDRSDEASHSSQISPLTRPHIPYRPERQ